MDPVTGAVQAVASPVAITTGAFRRGAVEFFGGVFAARRLSIENQQLSAQVTALSVYADTVGRLGRDVENLRRELGLPVPRGRKKIPAVIVGYVLRDNRVTIDAGGDKGLHPGLAVVGPTGLLGTLQTVSWHRSQVQLMTSRGLTIGAIVANRNPSPAGLLRGESSTTLSLSFNDPKAPVQIGDTVVTSGFSEFIPRGLPIGKVIQVEDDLAYGQRIAIVDPYATVGELSEVVVLK